MSRLNDLGDSRSLLYYPREQLKNTSSRTTSPNKKANASYSSASAVLFPKKTSSATWKLPVTSRKRNRSPDQVHPHSSSSKQVCPCCTSDDDDDDRRPVKTKSSNLSSKSNLILAGSGPIRPSSGPVRSNTKQKLQAVPLASNSTKIPAVKGSTSTTSTSSGYSSGSSRTADNKPSSSKSIASPVLQPVVAAGSSTQLPKSNKNTKVKALAENSDSGFPLPPRSPATYRRINRVQLKARLIKELHVEPNLVDVVLSSILDTPPGVSFDDVVGQEQAVRLLRERVVYPALNPNLFNGQKFLRPPRGVLLFGPTGNGKTLLAKACATQTNYNFMNLTASLLVSKWVGDSEKLIKIMFACAKHIQPCIIFIDEIDAVLSQRLSSDRDDSRRFKNEFLTHFDGLLCGMDDRVMVLGATNLPQSIDTAALRRFDLRIFLGPPDYTAREKLLQKILKEVKHALSQEDIRMIAESCHQYSASDLGVVARNAAWLPLGTIDPQRIPRLKKSEIPLIRAVDFHRVMDSFVPSGYQADLKIIEQWTNQARNGKKLDGQNDV